MYQYPYPPPQPAPPKRHRWRAPLIYLALVALVAVGVSVYVLLQRLSDEVLTVIATIGCAAGVALPAVLVALVVLTRRAEDNGRTQARAPAMTPPQVMVIPPMQVQQLPQVQQAPPAATWETVPAARHFVVVGEGSTEAYYHVVKFLYN